MGTATVRRPRHLIASLLIGDHDLTPVRDQAMERHRSRTIPLRDQLQVIRRRLWILSATLESLAAKIELAGRKSGMSAAGHEPDQPELLGDEAGDLRLARKAEGTLGGWRARWKVARLRWQAERAERRAAVAIHHATASFGAALEMVLHAGIAGVKADQACLSSCRAPIPRSCDRSSPDVPGTMLGLGISSAPRQHQAG